MTNANFDMTVAAETANLLAFFQKRSLMSGYLRSVLNANLFDPHQVTKPDWYDPLNRHLQTLQTQAQTWFNTASVTMTTLPQNYINFAMLGAPLRYHFDHWVRTNPSDPALHLNLMKRNF